MCLSGIESDLTRDQQCQCQPRPELPPALRPAGRIRSRRVVLKVWSGTVIWAGANPRARDQLTGGAYSPSEYIPTETMTTHTRPESFLPLTPVVFDILVTLAARDCHGYSILTDIRAR